MNILFLTLVKIEDIKERGIYTDLLREFVKRGHSVHVVTPSERREHRPTRLITNANVSILSVATFNIQKANLVEKGIGTLSIECQYLRAVKHHFSDIRFDLILYSTPPITFGRVIRHIKNRDSAFCYLLLKDIFPQNAVDLGMISRGGLLHKFFARKERKLYELSDAIGCMSPANVDFLLTHNSYLDRNKVEVNPNSIEPLTIELDKSQRDEMRQRFGLPKDGKIFIYGGNLGKPQGIEFLLATILASKDIASVFFVVIGSGTEYERTEKWFKQHTPKNAVLMPGLPKNEYDALVRACDVGLIFLHPVFTIPNFPSRLLSYLENRMPVIAATDRSTDIGNIIETRNCGFGVISGDTEKMVEAVRYFAEQDFEHMRSNALTLLKEEYRAERSSAIILLRALKNSCDDIL